MEVYKHHTISDLYQTLALPFENEINFTILSIPDIHFQIPFKSPKLRADYFSFILTIDGSGVYYLDENKFSFSSNSIYFTNPGHLKSYELNDSKEAYIISFTEGFLRENVHPNIYDEFPFLLAEIVSPQELTDKKLQDFKTLYLQIFHEFESTSAYKNKILGNLVTVLLLKMKEDSWLSYNPIHEGNRSSQIVNKFKQFLDEEFKKILELKHVENKLQAQNFAEKLNLHPNYLNSVIKTKTGKTVNEWISKRSISVAKSLLMNDSNSIKKIAFQLGFSEATHFSRFFKKHTKISPSTFRKSSKS